jgi:hypothetical protein
MAAIMGTRDHAARLFSDGWQLLAVRPARSVVPQQTPTSAVDLFAGTKHQKTHAFLRGFLCFSASGFSLRSAAVL